MNKDAINRFLLIKIRTDTACRVRDKGGMPCP